MNYSSLTPAQHEQVAFLFADDLFGTDPAAYEYELLGDTVIARARLDRSPLCANVRKPRTVRVNVCVREVPDAFLTVEADREIKYAIREIARSVVKRLIYQPVEA